MQRGKPSYQKKRREHGRRRKGQTGDRPSQEEPFLGGVGGGEGARERGRVRRVTVLEQSAQQKPFCKEGDETGHSNGR